MNWNRKGVSDQGIVRLLTCGGIAALAVCLLICLAGIAGAVEKEVKFASLNPVTGALATFGITLIHGVDMAVEEINTLGGIKSLGGAKLRLIRYDTQSEPEMGVTSTERAIKDGVVAIIGTTGGYIALPTTTIAEKNAVPMIVPETTANQITGRGYKYIFRICATDDTIGKADIATITSLVIDKKTGRKIKTIGVMHDDGPYGQELAKTIKELAKPYGIAVSPILSYPTSVTDFSSLILKVKESNIDFLYCVTHLDDGVLITKQLEELKYMPMGVYITGGTLFEGYQRAVGKLANYIFGDRLWARQMKFEGVPQGRVEALNAKYRSLYKEDMDGMAMEGFSAVYVLKDALERAASTDREKIRDALAKTNYYGGIQPCKGGRIQFDETGQNKNALFFGVQFLNGRAEVIWPAEYATAKPVFPVPRSNEGK